MPSPVRVATLAWQVPLSLGIAVLVLAGAGPVPAAVPGVALAAIAPELSRVDAREHRLPNRMTLPALAVSAAAVLASGVGGGPWIVAGAAGIGFGGGMLVLSLLGGIGMGDAKLAALIGLASPTAGVAVGAPVLGLLAGGVVGTAALLRRGPRHRIPLGPFLILGWVAALALSVLLGATGASST